MDPALQSMIDNMPKNTGKSLSEWFDVLKENPFEKHSLAVKFLKTEYGVGHGYANTIVTLSKKSDDTSDDLVTTQYNGKESLFPIYEALVKQCTSFGTDVKVVPKKTSVSLVRKKQFALIKPATKTRIDLGIKIKDKPTTERLENSGPFGTMCTHRVKISSTEEVDKELTEWLAEAYEKAG